MARVGLAWKVPCFCGGTTLSKPRFRSVMPKFCDHIKSLFVRKATHAANGMLEGKYVKLVSSITEGPTTPEFLSASASVMATKAPATT